MGRKFTGESLCDSYCRGCKYYGIFLRCCEYMFQTEQLRPCPAGKGCTVRTTKRGKTMAQVIDAAAYSYLARKEKEDNLAAQIRQSDLEGVSYGQWKSGQPAIETPRQETSKEPEGRFCRQCGKPLDGMRKSAIYCSKTCQQLGYYYANQKKMTDKNRRYRERKKKEAREEE